MTDEGKIERTKPVQTLLQALPLLPTVLLVDTCQHLSNPEDLLGMDGDVTGLARRAARRFCDNDKNA